VNNPWSSKNVGIIKHEFSLCYKAGISGLIVHLGNKTNEAIDVVLAKIMKFDEDHLSSVMLWLEINSVKSNINSFETPKKINKLYAKIAKITENSPLIVGLCVDTAHLWACGVSMTTYDNAKHWLDEIDPIPIMFHLNDSKEVFGSGKDVHQCITHGHIWRDIPIEKSGLAYISNYSKKNNCMVILERESVDDIKKEINILKKIGFIS
jgi:endonuclease IV